MYKKRPWIIRKVGRMARKLSECKALEQTARWYDLLYSSAELRSMTPFVLRLPGRKIPLRFRIYQLLDDFVDWCYDEAVWGL
jgi:hypothetical protein